MEDEEPSALQSARQEASRPEPGHTPSAPSAADPPIVPETLVDQLPPDADSDLLSEFVTESCEKLEGAEGAMLELESDPAHVEAVNRVYRAFHTIKGTSGFLGLTRTSSLAHHSESLLSRIRNNEIRFSGGYADLSLRAVDMLKGLIQGVADALSGRPMLVPAGYDELRSLLSNPEAAGISEQATSVQASRELLLTARRLASGARSSGAATPSPAPSARFQSLDRGQRGVGPAIAKRPQRRDVELLEKAQPLFLAERQEL